MNISWLNIDQVAELFALYLLNFHCCCCFASVLACSRVHSSVHHFNYSIAINSWDKIIISIWSCMCTYSNPCIRSPTVAAVVVAGPLWCGMANRYCRFLCVTCVICAMCVYVSGANCSIPIFLVLLSEKVSVTHYFPALIFDRIFYNKTQ